MWIFSWIKLSWHSGSNSIDSCNFSLMGYLPLIQKDFTTHMHGRAIYVKEGFHFAPDLSLENSTDWKLLLMFLTRFTSLSAILLFFYWSLSLSLCTVFYSILSNIGKVISINPSVNVFVFGDLSVHHNDCLICSGGTIDLVNSVIIFLSQMTSLRWLSFFLGLLTVILKVLFFWICFFLLTLVLSYNEFPSIGKFWSCYFLRFHWLSTKPKTRFSDSSFQRCSMGRYL